MNILTVIPARGESKRLKDKNIYNLLGKPLILWVAEECQKSKKINKIVVSTESKKIQGICSANGIDFIDRPKELSLDHVEKMDAISHATKSVIDSGFNPDIVISLQPNSPELNVEDLDGAIDFFIENLYGKTKVCEVISVNPDMLQNGCFRIMSRDTVFQKTLSTHVGAFKTNYVDIHTIEDVKVVEERLNPIPFKRSVY